ncbi:hypothetical protein [Sphingobacterium pedocola]|uniref:Uncharacterized protein n=1 Tax=Sphingobacterium pedocola TaxID=2082722 RepID=A0ABR9T5V6_9SPHI|nr:hypothetical protein [Sphingobacterium pedocola]MBE8720052.1 hypothetical protein [Sphingobacterium pedocola]
MENILITLVLVGGLIYNIYNNYKKEMEKTAKRDVRVPVPPVPMQAPSMPTRSTIHPPVIKRESTPPEVSHIQKYKGEKKIIPQALALEALEEKTVAFDLKQAVIQAAILDRPYR